MTIMDPIPDREGVLDLLRDSGWPRLSIYMPTGRPGSEAQKNQIRFKNRIQEAAGGLIAGGMRTRQVQDFLAPIRAMIDDQRFWRYQADGLCMFQSPNSLRYFRLPRRVPELTVVSKSYHIKPLLPLWSDQMRCYLLSVDLREVDLFEVDALGLRQVQSNDDLPEGIEEFRPDEGDNGGLQWHTGGEGERATAGTPGETGPIYHGHGRGKDASLEKERILAYLREVEDVVTRRVAGSEVPLILAGVEYLLPLYREANHYPHVLPADLPVNTREMSEDDLHQEVLRLMQPLQEQRRDELLERYRTMRPRQRTSRGIKDVLVAATAGRVDTLWAQGEAYCWGRYDPATTQVDIHARQHPYDEDLVNTAAVEALKTQAQVLLAEPEQMPEEGKVAALLRY